MKFCAANTLIDKFFIQEYLHNELHTVLSHLGFIPAMLYENYDLWYYIRREREYPTLYTAVQMHCG